MHVFSVNALAASGKTFSAIKFMIAGARAGDRFIIAVPSTLLVEQIAGDIAKAGCARVQFFHSNDGQEGSVTSRLTKHFKTTDYSRGEIVVMTMAALERLKYIERRDAWHLIIDEVPNPVYHERFSLNEHRHLLLDMVTERPWNAAYSLLHASETDTGLVMDMATNAFKDEVTAHFSELANKLLSDHWHVHADNEQLAIMHDTKAQDRAIDVFGLLQPVIVDGFKSVTIMGACFDDTLLYRYWVSLGVTFEKHPHIRPRFEHYANADLVTIKYAIDRDWSGKLRDTVIDGKRVIEHVAARMQAEIGNQPYVYLLNKSENDLNMPQGTALPHMSHGLHAYSHFHNAILLSALNPPPAYFGFVRDMAHLNPDEIKTAIYRAACYQAGLRISIRDLDNTDPKQIMVADKTTAKWIANLIGTSKIERIGGSDIVKPDGRRVEVAKSSADRDAAYRKEKQTGLRHELDEINSRLTTSFKGLFLKDTVSLNQFHRGSLFEDIGIQYPFASTRGVSVTSFRDLLADLHGEVVGQKTDRPLLNPCEFDPNKSDLWRGNENIVSISGIWLDNDGAADLAPDQFADMLNVPICVFNSFSSTVDKPRWRVWIPTSHLVTANVHAEIIAQIRKMLINRKLYGARYLKKQRDAGNTAEIKQHGFDESKFGANSNFYLPSQAKAGPAASFWIEKHWDKPLLNPYQWIDRSIVDHRPPTIPMSTEPVQAPAEANQQKVDKAIDVWRSRPSKTGNSAYFTLAASLKYANLPWPDADAILRAEAYHGSTQSSAQDRIKDLKSYRRKLWA